MSKNRSGGRRSGGGSGGRGGAVGHVEVIPFRPHHSWWVQALLMVLRWLPELLLLALVFWAVVKLHHLTGIPALVVFGVLLLLALAPLAWGPSRRWVMAGVYLSVTRHRLRVWFINAGIHNRSGRLPWIFWTIPTPVGERVWILLVPGLSVEAFHNSTEEIAAACWARTARVERARSNGAIVRLDVIRHDPLIGRTIPSVLVPTARASDENTRGRDTARDTPAEGLLGLDLANRPITISTAESGTAPVKPRRSPRTPPAAESASAATQPMRPELPDAAPADGVPNQRWGGEDLSDYV